MKKYTFTVEETKEGLQSTSSRKGFANADIVFCLELEKLRILNDFTKVTHIKESKKDVKR